MYTPSWSVDTIDFMNIYTLIMCIYMHLKKKSDVDEKLSKFQIPHILVEFSWDRAAPGLPLWCPGAEAVPRPQRTALLLGGGETQNRARLEAKHSEALVPLGMIFL